jgi:hypothetical protein
MTASARALAEFPLSDALIEHLTAVGRVASTPAERALVEPVLAGRDVWVTGERLTRDDVDGATQATLLAAVDLVGPRPAAPQVLVVLPTRDPQRTIAAQVGRWASALGASTADLDHVDGALTAQVAVGTVGRARDALSRGAIVPGCVRAIVVVQPELIAAADGLADVALLFERCSRAQRALIGGDASIGAFASRTLRAPEVVTLPLLPDREAPVRAATPAVEAPEAVQAALEPPGALGAAEDLEAPNAALAVAALAADGPVLVCGADADLGAVLDQLGVDTEAASPEHGRRLALARRLRRGEVSAAIVAGQLSPFVEARPSILHLDQPDDATRERREQGVTDCRVYRFRASQRPVSAFSVETLIDATDGVGADGWVSAIHELLNRDDGPEILARLARLAVRTARIEDQRAADADASDEPRRRRRKRRRYHGG